MIKNPSFEDLALYAQQSKLGHLHLPNGGTKVSFLSVGLDDLYRMVNRFVGFYGLTSDHILAVIAVGSAVHSPGYRETYTTRRKFFLFGPWIVNHRTVPIKPNDIDFLVLTDKNLGYDGTWLKKNGIHLVGRGVEQMTQCIQVNDTVAINALRLGVPVFFDERFTSLSDRIGIKPKTPRKIYWHKGGNECLMGAIN